LKLLRPAVRRRGLERRSVRRAPSADRERVVV